MHVVILLISSVISFSQYIKKKIYIYEKFSHEKCVQATKLVIISKIQP